MNVNLIIIITTVVSSIVALFTAIISVKEYLRKGRQKRLADIIHKNIIQ